MTTGTEFSFFRRPDLYPPEPAVSEPLPENEPAPPAQRIPERHTGQLDAGELLLTEPEPDPLDPVDLLDRMGFAWVAEHLAPLRDALVWLTANEHDLELTDGVTTVLDAVRRVVRELTADVCTELALLLSRYPPVDRPLAMATEGTALVAAKTGEALTWLRKLARSLDDADPPPRAEVFPTHGGARISGTLP